jgi:hypothetical protein
MAAAQGYACGYKSPSAKDRWRSFGGCLATLSLEVSPSNNPIITGGCCMCGDSSDASRARKRVKVAYKSSRGGKLLYTHTEKVSPVSTIGLKYMKTNNKLMAVV